MGNAGKPAGPGEESQRKADELPEAGTFADALKRARRAKERGDLIRAKEIMQAWRNRNNG